jgi:dihydrofolate reductase
MRRLILQQFTTIDGLAADDDGGTGFISEYAARGDATFEAEGMEFMDTIDTMVLGRRTYELFVQYWPEVSGPDAEFGQKLNSLNKYVVSTTLNEAPWGRFSPATIVRDPAEVGALKERPGKDIVIWGSISLATALLKQGVIDEVQLRVVPVALGSGKQLFDDELAAPALKLVEAKPHDAGLVLLRYETSR